MTDFFDKLKEKKKKNRAVLLGCGKSINDLSDENIKALDGFDVWASNNFMIHKQIVPDFYHLEVKPHRNGPLVSRLSRIKSQEYKDTTWIFDKTRDYIFRYFDRSAYSQENILVYPKSYRRESHGNYEPRDSHVSVSVSASMTIIIDLMVRMNYDEIYALGIDMDTSEYFWTDNDAYSDVLIEDIIKTTKPDERKPSEPHPTSHLAKYIPEFMRYNKQKFINLSQRSMLALTTSTKEINEILF